jgi:hypothetical protein
MICHGGFVDWDLLSPSLKDINLGVIIAKLLSSSTLDDRKMEKSFIYLSQG